jgi:DNA invertase Pin-like site-specific DNA recombinase
MRCIIYTRVSTEEQSLGLRAQLTTCTRYASNLSADILCFEDAGISGSKGIEERPGLKQALVELKKGDLFIVAKRDRIARDILLAMSVEQIVSKRGAKLISVAGEGSENDGVTGLILRTMTDLFSQIEREAIRSRTRSALQTKIAKGERTGSVLYGYEVAKDGVMLIPCSYEQDIIRLIKKLRKRGVSYRDIVKYMNEKGIRSRTGHSWGIQQVWNLANKK